MRDIKFRGKSKDDIGEIEVGDWLYGGIVFDNDRYWIDIPYYGNIIVDKDTIGQYIGIKDKNGKEIYEGDIIQDEFYERKAEVVFLEGAFWLDYKKDFGVYNTKHKRYQLLANYDYEQVLEVIGNIWENGDLLNDSK